MPIPFMKDYQNKKPMLCGTDVSVDFGSSNVLNKINFCIDEGEIAAIVGPNGAGKTTLLKAILGLIPYKGKITLQGARIQNNYDKLGYVPQKFNFDKTFPITVKEFISLTIKPIKKYRINEVLDEVDMTKFANKMIGELSGGQLQRVLIARALINEPRLLLLDEPTTGVDIDGMTAFYDLIDHLNKEHKTTIVMISHEINVVYSYATFVLCLNRDLYCQGIPKTALTKEVMKAMYGKDVDVMPHSHKH